MDGTGQMRFPDETVVDGDDVVVFSFLLSVVAFDVVFFDAVLPVIFFSDCAFDVVLSALPSFADARSISSCCFSSASNHASNSLSDANCFW